MDKSQMRIRPGFVLGLALIFALIYFISLLLPTEGGKTRAKIILTRLEETDIASALSQYASKIGGVTNMNVDFAFQALTNTPSVSNKVRTNANDEILDFWDTPFRITTGSRTNFIIHSAGPNHKFGDNDDIIFNSLSNDFVKP